MNNETEVRPLTIMSTYPTIRHYKSIGNEIAALMAQEIQWIINSLSTSEMTLLCRMNNSINGLAKREMNKPEKRDAMSLLRRGAISRSLGKPTMLKSKIGEFVYFCLPDQIVSAK